MRWLVTLLGIMVAGSAVAQDIPVKKKKKAASAGEMKAHQKPTKDQIRKFNELQKKQ